MIDTRHLNNQADLAHRQIEKLVREDWGKLLSYLIAHIGDFQLAEDALQDGLESALHHWHRNGLPRSPQAWLLQTARRKAIDRLRRNANFAAKQSEIQHLLQMDQLDVEREDMQEIPDERLRLIFTCCHPALDEKSRTALTLRTLGGLSVSEIARAFLDSEDAMSQRLVRAKRKIKIAAIPYSVPEKDEWQERLNTVLGVLYLIFSEGYFSFHGDSQMRVELSNEAIRLTKILLALRPSEPEIEGLLALMLLHNSRRRARHKKPENSNNAGAMIPLDEQDRKLWDKSEIDQGLKILNQALRRLNPGPYQIQAAISAIHSEADCASKTNWQEISLLYDELYKVQTTPIVLLNKCVAVSFAQNVDIAIEQLSKLENELKNYQPYYACRADLFRRKGNKKIAEQAYLKAIELSKEPNTRAFLERRLGEMLL